MNKLSLDTPFFNQNAMHPLCSNDDVTSTILYCQDPKTNVQIAMRVCTAWNKAATTVVKMQYITHCMEETRIKMAPYCVITERDFANCCPIFQELYTVQSTYPVKAIFDITSNLTEKYHGERAGTMIEHKCLLPSKFYANGRETIGQPLTNFHNMGDNRGNTNPMLHVFEKRFFPIQLFKLNSEIIDGKLKLIGNDGGNFCFCLNGKLIEIIIIPQKTIEGKETPKNYLDKIRNSSHTFPNKVYFPKLDCGDPITLKSVEDKLVVNVTDEKSPVNNLPSAIYTTDEINLINARLRGDV